MAPISVGVMAGVREEKKLQRGVCVGEAVRGRESFRKKREAQSQSLPVYPAAWEMKIGV